MNNTLNNYGLPENYEVRKITDSYWNVYNLQREDKNIEGQPLILVTIESRTTINGEDVYFVYTDSIDNYHEIALSLEEACSVVPSFG